MEITEVLMPVSILGSLGAAVYYFTRTVTDYILKKKMIEKGYVNEETQAIFKEHQANISKYPSLKWGLIALFVGLGFIIMEYIPVRPDSPLPYGLFAVSVSIGFLLYFFIVQREQK
jgi:hypothetical protein